jgi:hypothetical protein
LDPHEMNLELLLLMRDFLHFFFDHSLFYR